MPYFDPLPPRALNLTLCNNDTDVPWYYDLPDVFDLDENDNLHVSVDLLSAITFLAYDEDLKRIIQTATPEVGDYNVTLMVEDQVGGLAKADVTLQVSCNLTVENEEDYASLYSAWLADSEVTDDSPTPWISKIWSNGTVEIEWS